MDWERDGVVRLITYLREIKHGHNHTSSQESRERDFKSFYTQYDKRRGKDILKAFPMLKEWWDTIPETDVAPLLETIDGDDANSNFYVKDLQRKAKKEGGILTPQWANPGAQDYIEPTDDDEEEIIDFINDKD